MSETAKSGFRAEDMVTDEFHNWKESRLAKNWLYNMGFDVSKIRSISAVTSRKMGVNSKADVVIMLDGRKKIGISVKKFTASFNQIDKRWVDNYKKMWNIPNDVARVLKKYCGVNGSRPVDIEPQRRVKDKRRYFLTELTEDERRIVLDFFNRNAGRITHDILRGEKAPHADYILVIEMGSSTIKRSHIVDIFSAINHYIGPAAITGRGNLRLGKITIQRKGGDAGRQTAQMLQFKFSPREIYRI